MATQHITGYITKTEAARLYKVQLRTINDWVRKTNPTPENFRYLRIDGYIFIGHPDFPSATPLPVSPQNLERVRRFSRRNKFSLERLYAAIVRGEISAVVIVKEVFLINNEPALLQYLAAG